MPATTTRWSTRRPISETGFLRLGRREVGGREVVDEDDVALAPVVAVDGLRRRRDKVVDEGAEVGDGYFCLVGVGRALRAA